MSYSQYLRELLLPLNVYDPDGLFGGGELDSAGMALDGVQAQLEEILRESNLATAGSWGLERVAALLRRRPVTEEPAVMGQALAALLRVGGDSFTGEAVNDTLTGCGVPARAEEMGVGHIAVSFPGIPGVPEEFEELQKIIEGILPAHAAVEYRFWFLLWSELEQRFPTWKSIEDQKLTWEQLQTSVQ